MRKLRVVVVVLAVSALLMLPTPRVGATWPGQNGDIAYLSGPLEGNPRTDDVFVMAPDGSDPTNLTNSASPDDEDRPVWSPNGRKIVFVSNRDGDWEVFVMHRDGTRVKQLTHNQRADRDPSWSPDGRKIVYTSERQGVADLFVMRKDGTNRRRISSLNASAHSPEWSPTAPRIVFSMATGEDENLDLYTIRPDGARLRVIVKTPEEEHAPSWSPDGRWLVFGAVTPAPCGMCDPLEQIDVFVMASDGSQMRRLTDHPEPDTDPVWSPDGTQIAFVSEREDPEASDIFVMKRDGSALVNLTRTPGTYEYLPNWQPLP